MSDLCQAQGSKAISAMKRRQLGVAGADMCVYWILCVENGVVVGAEDFSWERWRRGLAILEMMWDFKYSQDGCHLSLTHGSGVIDCEWR